MNDLREILLDLQKQYPLARITDHVKLIYQNEYGCEHFAADPEESLFRLNTEYESAEPGANLFEPIGNGYVRLYLKNAEYAGLSPETLNRMFLKTAQYNHGYEEKLMLKLQTLYDLCDDHELPFSPNICQLYLMNYEAAGAPPVHHSLEYQKAYKPSYRVVHEDFMRFFQVFLRIDELLRSDKHLITVAIDGPCASGKSTLAALISACYDCNVFHTDDFFLRPEQRSTERLREVGGNMDRERLRSEVLLPLAKEESVFYRSFSCKTQEMSEAAEMPFCRLNIIEGSYSMHPSLRSSYDFKIALNISEKHQMDRLKRRESQHSLKRFRELWIPKELEYIEETALFDHADFTYQW